MPYIRTSITIQDIRDAKPTTIYYGVNTCWWTHRHQDLPWLPGSPFPCDARGGMLMITDNPAGFLRAAEANPNAYGKHGLAAFIAAHNDNCVVAVDDLRST